jgi:hypothetical protein
MRAFKVVRYFGGGPVSLDGETDFIEGARHTGVFVVITDLEYALYEVRDLAFCFLRTALYEVDAELIAQQPQRRPKLGAPPQHRRRWKELVLAGKLEEAERIFEGELQMDTYPLIHERIACAVTLLRPLVICRTSVARFEKPRVVTFLDAEVAAAARGIFRDWEVCQHDEIAVGI